MRLPLHHFFLYSSSGIPTFGHNDLSIMASPFLLVSNLDLVYTCAPFHPASKNLPRKVVLSSLAMRLKKSRPFSFLTSFSSKLIYAQPSSIFHIAIMIHYYYIQGIPSVLTYSQCVTLPGARLDYGHYSAVLVLFSQKTLHISTESFFYFL